MLGGGGSWDGKRAWGKISEIHIKRRVQFIGAVNVGFLVGTQVLWLCVRY